MDKQYSDSQQPTRAVGIPANSQPVSPDRPIIRFRPVKLVLGLALIVAATTLSAAQDGSTLVIIVGTAATALIVGIFLVSWETQRWEQIEQAFADTQLDVEKWQRRWHALHSDARQTATAFSHMLDGLVMISPEGTILLINDSARRLLGTSNTAELLGRKFSEVVRVPEINRSVEAARGGTNQVTTVEIVDGATVRPLRVQVDLIRQADDKRLLLMFRDETESKRVEEMRREFIANISHEIKTPLAAIKGYAETVDLAIKDDPEAALHFMSQIHSQCLRLERLIADMMQLARAQSGSQFLTIDTVRLGDTVAESLKSCRPVAEAKSIHLTVEGFQHDAWLRADREALLTIANNLIGNAIRYTPNGGHVCVSCRSDGDYYSLVVADDGVGIPLKEQDRIFERFYRVDKARESADGGTGIGLSVVKNLALAMNGRVAVTSSPNQGATFEVQLPRAEPPESAVGAEHQPIEQEYFTRPDLQAGTNA